jgi:hypothetical protein
MKSAILPRMVAVMLLLIAGGIGLAQAVSDPHQVTLRWLRLGGIIALSLIAVAGTIALLTRQAMWQSLLIAAAAAMVPVVMQLLLVQLARRPLQRLFAAAGWLVCAGMAAWIAARSLEHTRWAAAPSLLLASGLSGGFLITMLLGHAYLTAGSEMTQRPFARLVKMLALLLVLRALASLIFGLWPYLSLEIPRSQQMWNTLMVTSRYGVGLLVPAVFTCMIWDCVKRRSNQSATGILYVATVLVMIGEGIALGLIGETGVVF